MKTLLAIMLWANHSPYKAVKLRKVTQPEKAWEVSVVNKVTGCPATYRTNKPLQIPGK